MSDIAEHLGVSRVVVSAVLNNRLEKVRVGKETVLRIREAAKDLGYHRNHLALAMKTGVNPVVGCMVGGLSKEWTSRTLSGLLNATHETGYLTKIEEVVDAKTGGAALALFMEQRVAGIFCCNFNPEPSFVSVLDDARKRYKTPVVCTFSRRDLAAHWVDSDDRQGMHLAVEHLWGLGHRRIGFLGGNHDGEPRINGFREAMRKLGAEAPRFLSLTNWEIVIAEKIVEEWLGKKRGRPTAIVCANDFLAAVTIRAARRVGLRTPEDLSVTGFSDSSMCEVLDPPLTSVAQPFEEIGQCCGRILIKLISSGERPAQPESSWEFIPNHLVERRSTAKVPIARHRRLGSTPDPGD